MENKSINFKGAGLLGVLSLLLAFPAAYVSISVITFSSLSGGEPKRAVWLIFLLPLSFLVASVGLFLRKSWAFVFFVAPFLFLFVRIFLLR